GTPIARNIWSVDHRNGGESSKRRARQGAADLYSDSVSLSTSKVPSMRPAYPWTRLEISAFVFDATTGMIGSFAITCFCMSSYSATRDDRPDPPRACLIAPSRSGFEYPVTLSSELDRNSGARYASGSGYSPTHPIPNTCCCPDTTKLGNSSIVFTVTV